MLGYFWKAILGNFDRDPLSLGMSLVMTKRERERDAKKGDDQKTANSNGGVVRVRARSTESCSGVSVYLAILPTIETKNVF